MLSENDVKNLEKLCKENRRNILKMVYNAQSGHIGGAMSSVELLTVLYHKFMNVSIKFCNKFVIFQTALIRMPTPAKRRRLQPSKPPSCRGE